MNIPEFPDEIYDLLEKLDQRTFKHCLRVSKLCEVAEQYLNLDNRLSMAAKVHDIGKIYFSEGINNKSGVFTEIERKLMSLHPYLGYALLQNHAINKDIQQIVLMHHGTTPPHIGPLNLEAIPSDVILYANILHTIDTYEALISPRIYREKQITTEEAFDIIKKEEYANKQILLLIDKRVLVF